MSHVLVNIVQNNVDIDIQTDVGDVKAVISNTREVEKRKDYKEIGMDSSPIDCHLDTPAI